MITSLKSLLKRPVMFRIVACIVILLLGVIGLSGLAGLKKPPAEKIVKETKLKVETIIARPEEAKVIIKGFGEVTALNTVSITPEVTGKVVRVHPKLEIGQIITKGETLFEINAQDYLTTYEETFAAVLQTQNTIERLKKEYEISKTRLITLVRNQSLAQNEFQRIKGLYTENKIGTQSDVDTTERGYNGTVDQVNQMRQALATYPLQIKEGEYALRSANARLARAEANLRRCQITAPFTGRLKAVSIEVGQYVSPGQAIVTMVDDSVVEIYVSLDSVDAQKWLRFNNVSRDSQSAWFASLQPLPVEIRWTEETDSHTWEGVLDRVTNYDKQTRTITVAVRVEKPISLTNGTLPLVEGMFCEVSIPGKTMEQVYRIPRWAVSFRNTVFIEQNNRLKTVPVTVARIQNDDVFISNGLQPGDRVIVTRLVDPLENSLLEVISSEKQS